MQDKSGNGIGFLIGGIVLLLLSIPTFLKWKYTRVEMKRFRKGDYRGFERKSDDPTKIDYGKD
jgi:hypothetical protein